jgi:ribosomal protein S27E
MTSVVSDFYRVTCTECHANYTQRMPWGMHPPVICALCGDTEIDVTDTWYPADPIVDFSIVEEN